MHSGSMAKKTMYTYKYASGNSPGSSQGQMSLSASPVSSLLGSTNFFQSFDVNLEAYSLAACTNTPQKTKQQEVLSLCVFYTFSMEHYLMR